MTLNGDGFILRPWQAADLNAMINIYANPEAMRDFGQTLDADKARSTLQRYMRCYERHGFCRWAITNLSSHIIGMAGVQRLDSHPSLGPHDEVGWRLLPKAWGKGFATKAAQLSLSHYWKLSNEKRVLSYTSPDNLTSQAVMKRLNLTRNRELDFTAFYDTIANGMEWTGFVWSQPNPGSTEKC